MVFGILMPCIVIIACYSAIFAKVRQSRRNVQQHLNNGDKTRGESSSTPSQRKEDIKLTKMMLTIFISFLVWYIRPVGTIFDPFWQPPLCSYLFQVCFMPLLLVNVADEAVSLPFLHIVASILAWASAVINPFIYAFKNRQYQQAFAKVSGIGRRRNGFYAYNSTYLCTCQQKSSIFPPGLSFCLFSHNLSSTYLVTLEWPNFKVALCESLLSLLPTKRLTGLDRSAHQEPP